MPEAQPGQEQRMELTCNCSELPHHPLCFEATRPTADLGDDGELVDGLGDVLDIIAAAEHSFAQTEAHHAYYDKRHKQVQQARDRLILYREALERINRRASPNPERTLDACADDLVWIADDARAALSKSGGA